MEPIIVTLQYPVEIAEPGKEPKMYKELVFKGKLKTKHLLAAVEDLSALAFGMSGQQTIDMLAAWAEVPKQVIEDLDAMEDLPEVMKAIGPFLPQSQQTGTKSSGE